MIQINQNFGIMTILTAEDAEVLIAAQGKDIVIPDFFTSIDERAFFESDLTSVAIPSSITSIGEYAFYKNPIEAIEIPSNVESIGNWAFGRGGQLKELRLPNSNVAIGVQAFYSNQLTTLVIPDEITEVGSGAFQGNELSILEIGKGLTWIKDSVFASNKLTSLNIPDHVAVIGDKAFQNNAITDLVIPGTVEYISDEAFASNQISSLTLPESEITVQDLAFANNKLTSIFIPGLADIDSSAFDNNQIAFAFISDGSSINADILSYNNPLERISVSTNYYVDSDLDSSILVDRRGVNDPPASLTLSNHFVYSNSNPGDMIALLNTSDPDPDDSHIYSLVAGEGDDYNYMFSIEDNKLVLSNSAELADNDFLVIRVQVSDVGGLIYDDRFLLEVAEPEPSPYADHNGDGFVDEITNYQMWTASGGVDLTTRRGRTLSDDTSRRWDIAKAIYEDWGGSDYSGGFYLIKEGERRREGFYRILAAEDTGVLYWRSDWYSGDQMHSYGYEETFEMDFNGNGVVDVF